MNTSPAHGRVQAAEEGAQAQPLHYGDPVPIPDYLERHYWWAYVRPWAVRVFEREWLINFILWGWYRRLRDAALDAFGEHMPGRTLHISCCYGSLIPALVERVGKSGGTMDVVDVAPAQLDNLRRKLPQSAPVRLMLRDSTDLKLPDATYDRAVLFFLPHEQPREARARTFAEAFRVLKPGGKALIIEFGKPAWWHPLRYLYLPFLAFLEPFAPDIWDCAVAEWLPKEWKDRIVERKTFFGGYYQRLLIER